MIFDRNILCFTCKGCGDIEAHTTISANPGTGRSTKTTTLGKIWCDKREDLVEPRLCCPCYEEDAPDYEDLEEAYDKPLIIFPADEDTQRRIYEAAQHNNMTEGQLVSRAVDYYLKEVMQP